jgi:hypothetical protein
MRLLRAAATPLPAPGPMYLDKAAKLRLDAPEASQMGSAGLPNPAEEPNVAQ